MHFLIGFLIVCVIFAVPALRKVALVLIGITALLIILWLANNPVQRETGQPPMNPQQAAALEKRSRELISPNEIELRQVQFTSPSGLPQWGGSIEGPGILAVVRNNSERYTLTQIAFNVDLLDCPRGADAITSECEQVGAFTCEVAADIPPSQVRQMSIYRSTPPAIKNVPPLRGQLMFRYKIEWIKGKEPEGAVAPGLTSIMP